MIRGRWPESYRGDGCEDSAAVDSVAAGVPTITDSGVDSDKPYTYRD
jgi:hypothetical protein